jgi:serine/threonine protein kinase
MESLHSNKDRISRLLSKRHGSDPSHYHAKLEYIAEGTYTKVYGYRESAFKVDCNYDRSFSKNKEASDKYIDDNIMRELIGHVGIAPHPNIVRIIDIHHDADGFIVEMERMDSVMNYDNALPHLNDQIFEDILRSLLNATAHLHSYGIVHGDIKPTNLLVKNIESHQRRFALCDLNLIQYLPYSGFDKSFFSYGTPHFAPKENTEFRSFGTDIRMIGATMVDIILNIGTDSQITLGHVVKNESVIIQKVGERNYQILCLMLERHPSRPYIQHILQYLSDRSRTPFEIYAEQGRDIMFGDEYLLPAHCRYGESALSAYMTNGYCTPRCLFEEGLRYYQMKVHQTLEVLYPKIEADFEPMGDRSGNIDGKFDRLSNFRKDMGKVGYDLYTLNTVDCLYNQIRNMGIDRSPAMYVAHSLVLFPSATLTYDWVRRGLISDIRHFNSEVLKFISQLGRQGQGQENASYICMAPSIDQHIGSVINYRPIIQKIPTAPVNNEDTDESSDDLKQESRYSSEESDSDSNSDSNSDSDSNMDSLSMNASANSYDMYTSDESSDESDESDESCDDDIQSNIQEPNDVGNDKHRESFMETISKVISNMWSKDYREALSDTASDPGGNAGENAGGNAGENSGENSGSNISIDSEGNIIVSGHKRSSSSSSAPSYTAKRNRRYQSDN